MLFLTCCTLKNNLKFKIEKKSSKIQSNSTDSNAKKCYRIDLAGNPKTWVGIKDLPEFQAYHALVFVPLMNKLYYIGGAKSKTSNLRQVYSYDLKTELWTTSSKFI